MPTPIAAGATYAVAAAPVLVAVADVAEEKTEVAEASTLERAEVNEAPMLLWTEETSLLMEETTLLMDWDGEREVEVVLI
jgi:hypothetical protein